MIVKSLLRTVLTTDFYLIRKILRAFQSLILDMAHPAVYDNRSQLRHTVLFHQQRTIHQCPVTPHFDMTQIQLHIDNHVLAYAGNIAFNDTQRIAVGLRHSRSGKRCHAE